MLVNTMFKWLSSKMASITYKVKVRGFMGNIVLVNVMFVVVPP
jgi:hypothetical protein